jgi:hypothetical protein
MSIKVSPFMGGLGIDATDKFEVLSNATVTVGDGTTTGNIVVGTITAGTFNGLSSNSIGDSDSAVSIIDPAVSIISNDIEFITIDQTQGVETQFQGNVSIGTNASNTFSITGILDLGSF